MVLTAERERLGDSYADKQQLTQIQLKRDRVLLPGECNTAPVLGISPPAPPAVPSPPRHILRDSPPLPGLILLSIIRLEMLPLLSSPPSDFTLTSPILDLIPEQRHFHTLSQAIWTEQQRSLYALHLLYPEPETP